MSSKIASAVSKLSKSKFVSPSIAFWVFSNGDTSVMRVEYYSYLHLIINCISSIAHGHFYTYFLVFKYSGINCGSNVLCSIIVPSIGILIVINSFSLNTDIWVEIWSIVLPIRTLRNNLSFFIHGEKVFNYVWLLEGLLHIVKSHKSEGRKWYSKD